MVKTFCSSDLHFQHKSILKYCPHRVDTSFTGDINTATPDEIDHLVQLMNERIISNWNSVVGQDDNVLCLGDICMGQIVNAPKFIRRLNGKKTLIKGNHDKTLVKLIKNDPTLSDLFVAIHDVYETFIKIDNVKIPIFMSHYPHAAWPMMNQGAIHIFGHPHGSEHNVTGRLRDIGMDTNDLFPYDLDDVVRELLKIDIIRSHH